MDMNTQGLKIPCSVKCLQKYGAVLFEGAIQLKLFLETKIKLFEYNRSAAQFEGVAKIE